MTHDEIQADLPLYGIGSLEAAERAEIDRHLADGCTLCEGELSAWRDVTMPWCMMRAVGQR